MNGKKTIILSADDFGLTPSVSQGILKLVQLQRLSAVSCMVNKSDFVSSAQDLLVFKSKVQVGLHFNLTDGVLLSDPQRSCFNLYELLIKTHLGLIKPLLIVNEFNAQLDLFIETMGCLPDFIDGHHHVHQFPVIRQIILDLYEQRLRQNRTYIRSTYPAISLPEYQLKTKVLALTGGRKLQLQLVQRGIPHNSYFSGIYDIADGTDYRGLFRRLLALVESNTLIMCHPDAMTYPDSIVPARLVELDYFSSDAFINDCNEFHVNLTTGPKP